MHFRSNPLSPFLFLGLALFFLLLFLPLHATPLVARDADNQSVELNVPGDLSLVMYTSPDLETDSRQITLALDHFRGRSDFHFVRVVDLRGLPAPARLIVRAEIDNELDKENKRLAPIYSKNGVAPVTRTLAPIVPDYNGNTLQQLGWKGSYDQVQVVIYNKSGAEIKRMEHATPDQVSEQVQGLLE